jgi:hypothetical protein
LRLGAQRGLSTLQRLHWRSIRDAPPTSEWLRARSAACPASNWWCLRCACQSTATLLHEQRSLLMLDNFETVLQAGDPEGGYRRRAAPRCLVVTSRESPPQWVMLRGDAVGSLQLGGLGVAKGQVLLADKGLSGSTDEWASLVDRFGGNGLALKVVGETIRELFGGELGAFPE